MRVRYAATLILGAITLACSGDLTSSLTDPAIANTPENVFIVPPTSTDIIVGTSISLTVAIKNANGGDVTGLPITWTSSDPSVASVSSAGLLTAVKVGAATITGAVGNKSASVAITVKPVPVAKVVVSFRTPILPGETAQASATPQDAGGTTLNGRTVTWSSSDATVATINASGLITAVSFGAATITATVDGVPGTAIIIINIPPVATVAVSLSAPSVAGTGTVTATAVLKDGFGNTLTGRNVAWSSSNQAVATVNATGTVTALDQGTTTITATSEGKSGVATFTVLPLPVASITVTTQSQILKGHSSPSTAVIRDTRGNVVVRPLTWSSSTPSVASVDPGGTITGVNPGTTTINASAEGVTGGFTVTIVPPPLASVLVTSTAATLQPTQTTQATAAPRDVDNQPFSGGGTITWQSSNPAALTVSSSGLVTAVGAGTAQITASLNGVSGSVSITVPPVVTINLTTPTPSRQPGQTTQVTAALLDGSSNAAINRTVTWTSSAAGVATVSASGLVTAIASGTAIIRATSEGVNGSVTITVPPVTTINLTTPAASRQPGQTTQVTADLLDASNAAATNRTVTWSSSTPAVATVSATGFVTAIAAGTTTITATSEGVNGTLLITVPPVATVNLSAPNVTRQPGQTTQVTAVLLDATSAAATNRTVTWASSVPGVATVNSSGFVNAIASGTTAITATSEGIVGTINITVPPVVTVNVTAVPSALLVAQTVQASASLLDGSGNPATNRTITWSSVTPSVATVNASGLVTAVALGTSVLTATSEGRTGTITIQVVPPVGSVQVSGAPTSMLKSQTAQLNALILDTFGAPVTNIAPVWTSSNPARATISNAGLVTAVGVSTLANVTFTATAAGVSSSVVVPVLGHPPEVTPALPQVFINTAMPAAPAAGGAVIPVLAGDNLQTKINNAQPGDVLELAAGATFKGNFTLPNKTGNAWIVIRPSNYASLPSEGTRMTPALAASLNLPKIVTNNTLAAIQPQTSAHNYRFVGIEVTFGDTVTLNYGLVSTETVTPQTTLSAVAHDITFDRMYIHGSATGALRRCLSMNSAYTALIDSWLSDCHDSGQDAQAIAGWTGPGPFKIVNNYLEASTENIIFGGADPSIPNLVPSDIEIRRNHIIKPAAWKHVWLAKNLLELKNAQRVLVEANIMDGSWTDGQTGFGIVMWSNNQQNTAPWSTTSDITLRQNYISNVGSGFSISSSNENTTVHARRYLITDNVVSNVASGIYDGDGRGFQLLGDLTDITIAHNTVMSPPNTAVSFGGSPSSIHTSIRDNIINGGQYGIVGDGVIGAPALTRHATDGTMSANVFLMSAAAASGQPTGNFYSPSAVAIGFVSPGTVSNGYPADLSLSGASAYIAAGSDGLQVGANISALMAAVLGVIVH